MAPIIKSKEEREKIRETGRIVAAILAELRDAVHPGMTTAEIDKLGAEALKRYGAKSSSLGYHGYPASLCTSVNEEVVHGIPGSRCWLRATSSVLTSPPLAMVGTRTPP